MPANVENSLSAEDFKSELEERGNVLGELPGWMFEGLLLFTNRKPANDVSVPTKDQDCRMQQACDTARFAGARLTNDLKEGITHALVGKDRSTTRTLRMKISE